MSSISPLAGIAPAQSPLHRDAVTDNSARGMSRTNAAQPLMPLRALEDRRLIHRQESVRVQADAFRDLRTRLITMGGNLGLTILVAPVAPGCGSSFVARNLALAFAFDETKKAVLVDCDALHPSQHSALGITAGNGGLMDYLDGSVVDPRDIRYPTGIERLSLIPNGTVREISGEYFSSARAGWVMQSLRAADPNCFVILDGPPVLRSPDARILSDLADLVVLVAGYGKTRMDGVEQAAANFDPAKFAGVVFNEGT